MKSSLFGSFLLFALLTLTPVRAAEVPAPALYYQIEEPFTINFQAQSQNRMRYLQVKVALMSHQADTIHHAEQNLPMIQDALRNLFAEQNYDTVSTVEGRQQLQRDALTLVSTLLQQETGQAELEQVYFTSFILQ